MLHQLPCMATPSKHGWACTELVWKADDPVWMTLACNRHIINGTYEGMFEDAFHMMAQYYRWASVCTADALSVYCI